MDDTKIYILSKDNQMTSYSADSPTNEHVQNIINIFKRTRTPIDSVYIQYLNQTPVEVTHQYDISHVQLSNV